MSGRKKDHNTKRRKSNGGGEKGVKRGGRKEAREKRR